MLCMIYIQMLFVMLSSDSKIKTEYTLYHAVYNILNVARRVAINPHTMLALRII